MCILVVSRYSSLMICSLCYYREHREGGLCEGVVTVIQWILTEHYQEGRVSEELQKEMLFWSCRYVYTVLDNAASVHTLCTYIESMYITLHTLCTYIENNVIWSDHLAQCHVCTCTFVHLHIHVTRA